MKTPDTPHPEASAGELLAALRAALEEYASLYDMDPDDALLPSSDETYADALIRWHIALHTREEDGQ